jgi:hypothetical protein
MKKSGPILQYELGISLGEVEAILVHSGGEPVIYKTRAIGRVVEAAVKPPEGFFNGYIRRHGRVACRPYPCGQGFPVVPPGERLVSVRDGLERVH